MCSGDLFRSAIILCVFVGGFGPGKTWVPLNILYFKNQKIVIVTENNVLLYLFAIWQSCFEIRYSDTFIIARP